MGSGLFYLIGYQRQTPDKDYFIQSSFLIPFYSVHQTSPCDFRIGPISLLKCAHIHGLLVI